MLRLAPCPISSQAWYHGLGSRERDGSITCPTTTTLLAAAKAKARSAACPPGNGAALADRPPHCAPSAPSLLTWERFLDQAPQSASKDVLTLLDGLSSVLDASASHIAEATLIIIRELHAKAHRLLNLTTTSALLVQAAKNARLQCREANKHRLRLELGRLCAVVASKYSSALNHTAKNNTLLAILPHITTNELRPEVNWQSVALNVATTAAFPITAHSAM